VAKCLAFHTYSPVHVPTEEDEAVRDFIRMRDDIQKKLKGIKQETLAWVLRHGYRYGENGGNWTARHVQWLRSLELSGVEKETMDEYLLTYEQLKDKVERLDKRIEELAASPPYIEGAKKLSCLLGVRAHTALSVIVETGDFARFASAERYASFTGLTPGENSSGESQMRTGITKAGNTHVRTLLVEAAQSYSRGTIGRKSITLKRRQQGNDPAVIAYADKANERLRRKFYRMTLQRNAKRSVAVAAVARELACFMWGMMTGNIYGAS